MIGGFGKTILILTAALGIAAGLTTTSGCATSEEAKAPTYSLTAKVVDEPGEEHIYELINRLQTQHNLASIMVSHDLSFVFRYATKVLCLNRQQVCFGTPTEALSADVLTKLYGEAVGFYDHHHHD